MLESSLPSSSELDGGVGVGVGLGLGFGLALGVGVDGLSFSSFSSSGSVVEDSLSLEELLRSTTVKVMVLPGIKSNRFASG